MPWHFICRVEIPMSGGIIKTEQTKWAPNNVNNVTLGS